MERRLLLTKDGSYTVTVPEQKVTYHSIHGALQESRHVFINAGLLPAIQLKKRNLSILEVGFGTGLNALLTAIEVEKTETSVYYVALEPYPLEYEKVLLLNYCQLLGRTDLQEDFTTLHRCEWDKSISFTEYMLVHKSGNSLETFLHATKFDLIYYDAFAPAAQPELWTQEVFLKLFSLLYTGGLLVTYCSKGDVRRAMQSAGFRVEKIPGPAGKREMIRAGK